MWTWWNEDGSKINEGEYKNDIKYGEWTYWDEKILWKEGSYSGLKDEYDYEPIKDGYWKFYFTHIKA